MRKARPRRQDRHLCCGSKKSEARAELIEQFVAGRGDFGRRLFKLTPGCHRSFLPFGSPFRPKVRVLLELRINEDGLSSKATVLWVYTANHGIPASGAQKAEDQPNDNVRRLE